MNDRPESKRVAIEHEIKAWGLTHYDRQYYVENIMFCPSCARISHLSDWLEVSRVVLAVARNDYDDTNDKETTLL